MDTETFLLERHSLQDRLASVRAYSLAAAQRRRPWWLMLPIFPIAGWVLSKGTGGGNGNGRHPHPILKSFLTAGIQKLIATLAKGSPSQAPSLFKRLFN